MQVVGHGPIRGEGEAVGFVAYLGLIHFTGVKSLRSVIGQSLGVYQPVIKGRGVSAAAASVPLADEVAPLPLV